MLVVLAGGLLAVAGCRRPNPNATVVKVTMRKYAIEPNVIRLKVNQAVRFEVSTADVQHGFYVPALNIRESVQPGKPAIFEFTPDKAGVYEMKCSILCGPGHDQMVGKIVVE